MKKLYIILSLTLPLVSMAQKTVDLDRYRFTVQYRSLPSVKLDSTYRTYNVEVSGTKLMNPFLDELDPARSVRLEGWKQLDENGHLKVSVKLGDLLPGDVSVKERVVSTKNRNGQITGTKIYYWQEVTYSFEANAVISDYKGMHIQDEELMSRTNKLVYRSPEFTLRPMAEGYFLLNSLAVTKELFRDNVSNAMHILSNRLNNNFGFNAVTVNDYMWVVGKRKHPEYDNWRKAIQQVMDVLFTMNANTPITGAKEEVQPAINYFEKIKKLYSSNNRHDRKIRYGCYYNLAVLYYYLDDPQLMMKEANGLELNDFDPKDAKGFKTTATWLRNLFEQNNIYTRHFPVNPDSYKGPLEQGSVSVNN